MGCRLPFWVGLVLRRSTAKLADNDALSGCVCDLSGFPL